MTLAQTGLFVLLVVGIRSVRVHVETIAFEGFNQSCMNDIHVDVFLEKLRPFGVQYVNPTKANALLPILKRTDNFTMVDVCWGETGKWSWDLSKVVFQTEYGILQSVQARDLDLLADLRGCYRNELVYYKYGNYWHDAQQPWCKADRLNETMERVNSIISICDKTMNFIQYEDESEDENEYDSEDES